MNTKKNYCIPDPLIDYREECSMIPLTRRYNRMIKPSAVKNVGNKILAVVPQNVKDAASGTVNKITKQDLFQQALKYVGEGFEQIENQVSKYTVSEKVILKEVNEIVLENDLKEIREICLARGYELSKLVKTRRDKAQIAAAIEGGGTGMLGFAGIPANLVLSITLYYRAVQMIAMYYGYDVKNDVDELFIAASVFRNALAPGTEEMDELTSTVGKFMAVSTTSSIKSAAAKSWAKMIEAGQIGVLLTQIRSLSNTAAKQALKAANKKVLEKNAVSDILEQLSKHMTLKNIGRFVPVVSGLIGAAFDTSQITHVMEYADVFYNRRFLAEKEANISYLMNGDPQFEIIN